MDDEEIEPGLRCIAAAVRGHSGEVTAAISIAGPSSRLHREDLERHAESVVAAARQISAALGAPAGSRCVKSVVDSLTQGLFTID